MSDNKDQAQGTVSDVKGKAQEAWGNVTGNEQDQAEGKGKQVKGDLQKGLGNVKDAVDDAKDDHS
jgi:uncharacterized protein YjbJ (UPF0337 family)